MKPVMIVIRIRINQNMKNEFLPQIEICIIELAVGYNLPNVDFP